MKALLQGLKTVLAQSSDTDIITYNGVDYRCRCSAREMRLNLESSGFLNIKGLTVYIDLDVQLEETITYNNVNYKVMTVTNYSQNINKLDCEELF